MTGIRKPLAAVIACALTVLALDCCTGAGGINVVKKPISVETKYLEDVEGKKAPLKKTDKAVTTWNFGCTTNIGFDVTEKDLIDPDYLVTIKVTGARVELDAPVQIWISKNAPEEIVDHEKAHVEICRRVYRHADEVARQAARNIVGQSFQSSARSYEKALKLALDKAGNEICESYHLETVEEINRVSEIFDELEKSFPKAPHKELIDKSFLQYMEIKGK